ncbi:hypothetical protein N806_11375 [Rhodococcus sp. P27]|nr:hypothetical protein N806_11375 [Rhodococcus sp. P27]GCB59612.1 hypothetical protein rerp_60200 [Rhodococcus erythropolis]
MHMTHTVTRSAKERSPMASRVVEEEATADPYGPRRAVTVARLALEFAGQFSVEGVEIVLDGCILDLSWVSYAAMPELSERLARQRISSYCHSKNRGFR